MTSWRSLTVALVTIARVVFALRLVLDKDTAAIFSEADGPNLNPKVPEFHPRVLTSVVATMAAINGALSSQGGVYSTYSCKTVSWDDVSRGTVGGALSVWGPNIADTRLWAESGELLYTVRSDNWNEKLGRVSADEVALVASQQDGSLRPVTLRDTLKGIGQYGSYAGLPADLDLTSPEMDAEVSIRFQTTFLPVADTLLASVQFAPEMYSYQTMDDADPRNLLLLATTQGVAVQQDGRGATRLYSHAIGPDGKVKNHWFEAERSSHGVGGAQKEDATDKEEAAVRGKATASVIGIRAMGTRFNVLATVQVPLKQTQRPVRSSSLGGYGAPSMGWSKGMVQKTAFASAASMDESMEELSMESMGPPEEMLMRDASRSFYQDLLGQSNAARVSQGEFVDNWKGLSVSKPERDDTQHVTVTVVLYNTVAGGIPSKKDIVAAIDDMEQLYKACGWSGKRSDSGAAFSTDELTVKNIADIAAKIKEQPYKVDVQDSEVFPSSRPDI